MKLRSISLIPLVLLACGGDNTPAKNPDTTPSATTPPPPPPPVMDAGTSAAVIDAGPPAPTGPTPVAKWTGMMTPESVLYDEANDRYLVSNINGDPTAEDSNGFISELSPDGTVKTLKWIEGNKNKVKLDAPKGSAISNGALYVADIKVVRVFDLKTGAQKPDIKIPGATFLNDVAAGPDGTIYVTDSGIKFGKNGAEPTGSASIWAIDKAGKPKTLIKGAELNGPNGVAVDDKKNVIANSFMSNEVFRVDDKGKKVDTTKTPKGSLDGLIAMGDTLLVSSWEGQAVYKGKLNGTFEAVISNQKSPADIGWDKKRSRVLIPHFEDNVVEAYELK